MHRIGEIVHPMNMEPGEWGCDVYRGKKLGWFWLATSHTSFITFSGHIYELNHPRWRAKNFVGIMILGRLPTSANKVLELKRREEDDGTA